jgi:hypothetical protein
MDNKYPFLKNCSWLLAFSLISFSHLRGDDLANESFGMGLLPPTQKQLEKIEQTWGRIVYVKPNKIGAARIQAFLAKKGKECPKLPVKTVGKEFLMTIGKKTLEAVQEQPLYELPSYVNNSTLPSFPPIRSQSGLGSCVSWATGYYQTSHEIGLVRGFNNKESDQHIISPKWLYNFVNWGKNKGSYINTNYDVLTQNGAPSLVQFPYDRNYLAWDPNPYHWVSALYNRMSPPVYISGVNESPQNLRAIKELLNNGHVLTFGTFVGDWLYTKIKEHPDTANRFVGEGVAYWGKGTYGAHMMTIVGYDDEIWVDINGNGQVDPGEKGAFLVANSWGDKWGNKGFTWVAYDAFLSQSAVPNPPNLTREPAASVSGHYLISCLPKATEYTPKLVAQFKLGQTARDQISISAGASDSTLADPERFFTSGAVAYQGGPYRFDGTTSSTPQYATFTLDLTDLAIPNKEQKFYLMVRDNATGNETFLNNFRLIDLTNGNVIRDFSKTLKVDYDKITRNVKYTLSLPQKQSFFQLGMAKHPIKITSPIKKEVVQGLVPVTVHASSISEIANIEFYIDGFKFASDSTAPFWVLLDSEKYANGEHDLTITAYDKDGQSCQDSVKITISNE